MEELLRIRGNTELLDVLLTGLHSCLSLGICQFRWHELGCTSFELQFFFHNPDNHSHLQISPLADLPQTQFPLSLQQIRNLLDVLRSQFGSRSSTPFAINNFILAIDKPLVPKVHLSFAHRLVIPHRPQSPLAFNRLKSRFRKELEGGSLLCPFLNLGEVCKNQDQQTNWTKHGETCLLENAANLHGRHDTHDLQRSKDRGHNMPQRIKLLQSEDE